MKKKWVILTCLLIIVIVLVVWIVGYKKETATNCLEEGAICNFASSPECLQKGCCGGLNFISCDTPNEQGKCRYGCLGVSYCTNCGDGVCKEPENKCNCPLDCEGAICGNGICEEGECSYEQFLTCSSYDQTYCNCLECNEDCK